MKRNVDKIAVENEIWKNPGGKFDYFVIILPSLSSKGREVAA